jgi:hypothetical protein
MSYLTFIIESCLEYLNRLILALGVIAGLTTINLVPSTLFTQNVANAASCSGSSQSASYQSSANGPPSNTQERRKDIENEKNVGGLTATTTLVSI